MKKDIVKRTGEILGQVMAIAVFGCIAACGIAISVALTLRFVQWLF